MKIDKSKLEAMSALSDDELWWQIKSIALAKGISMPDKKPSKEELARVRAALSEADKLNLHSAMRLINDLKRGG